MYFKKNGGDKVGFVEDYEKMKGQGRKRRNNKRKEKAAHQQHHKMSLPETKPSSGGSKSSPLEGISSLIRELGGGQRGGIFVVNVGDIHQH